MTKCQAQAEAEACLKLMKTKGWKIRVHENWGWHWSLQHVNGHFNLYGDDGKYWTLLSDGKYQNSGEPCWTPDYTKFTDPNKAVAYQLKLAKEYIKRRKDWVNHVINTINHK